MRIARYAYELMPFAEVPVQPSDDKPSHAPRSTAERCFNRLKRFRAAATRYDKLAVRYEATVQVVMNLGWKPQVLKQALNGGLNHAIDLWLREERMLSDCHG